MDWKAVTVDVACFVALAVTVFWVLTLAWCAAVRGIWRTKTINPSGLRCSDMDEAEWREAVAADLAALQALIEPMPRQLAALLREVTNPEDDETTLRDVVEAGPLAGTLFSQLDQLEAKFDAHVGVPSE